ncbi:restriction endonuclease subunit S [Faecalibacter macacae]|uniref:Restriction endonuclease subunit S n=1 Tax=Faecalibacter macacae TaxID=1859289 RepID=A0A3L9MBM2_9FLAO|nr:restriction endonuclease subunit S [Faecalibacter macacae]RLZ10455.1 restriction endonuclease subunit S [Faecalibacter macacae]
MSNFIKLKDVCIKITDGAHYSPIGVDEGFPMYSVKDMNHNGFDSTSCKYISENDYNDLVKADCKPLVNDVLIAKDGSYLKHVFVIREEKEEVILSSIGILRPDIERINPHYLKYYLHTKSVKDTVAKKYVSGSALPRIILKNFGEIEIINKPINEQQKIAVVLSALDDKIEVNNKINAELEAMAKTLYDYWFVQFEFPITNESHPELVSGSHPVGYKSSGGKMVYNPTLKREIPEGWEVKELNEIANITMGQSPSGESYNSDAQGIIFFQGSTDFGWRYPENRMYTSQPTRFAKEDDILLSVRAPVGTMNIAMYDCCIGRGLASINSKEGFNSYIIYLMNEFKKRFDFLNGVGTTFGSLTKDDLFTLKLAYPNKDILAKFNDMVSIYDAKIKINTKQNQELAQLRDWLLPMLMNGQVTVE